MQDKLTDVIDIGSQLAETQRAASEAEQRQKAAPKQVKNLDGTWPTEDCDECGEPIGYARLEAIGAITCIHCETRKEKEGKQYGSRK